MKISTGNTVYSKSLKTLEFSSWADFARHVLRDWGAKKDGPYICPGYIPSRTRGNGGVEKISLLCFDLDHTAMAPTDVARALDGLAHIWYTTYSHTDEDPRYRILIPCADDIGADGYRNAVGLAAAMLGLSGVSGESGVPSQAFYLPRAGWSGGWSDGELLDGVGVLGRGRGGARPGGRGHGDDDDAFAAAPTLEYTRDEIAAMLAAIPSDDPRVPGEEDPARNRRMAWLSVGTAIKSVLGDDGLDLYIEWSAGRLAPSGGVPDNFIGPQDVTAQWRALRAGRGVGAGTLRWRAERFGWGKPPSGALGGWVFVSEGGGRYFHRGRAWNGITGQTWAEEIKPDFLAWHRVKHGEKAKKNPSKEYMRKELMTHGLLRAVHSMAYLPGRGEIDGEFYNTYVDTGAKAPPGMVPDLERLSGKILHMYKVAWPGWRWTLLLDIAAYVYQNPGKRLGWMAIAQSQAQGIGKSLLTVLLKRALGTKNAASIDGSAVSDSVSSEWVNRVFIEFEELAVEKKDMDGFCKKIKRLVSNDTIDGRRTGGIWYSAPNTATFYTTMNDFYGFEIADEDRRWVVIKSPLLHQRDGIAEGLTPELLDEIREGVTAHPEIGDYILRDWVIGEDFNPAVPPAGDTRQYISETESPEIAWVREVLGRNDWVANKYFVIPGLIEELSEGAVFDKLSYEFPILKPISAYRLKSILPKLGYTQGTAEVMRLSGIEDKPRIKTRPFLSREGWDWLQGGKLTPRKLRKMLSELE